MQVCDLNHTRLALFCPIATWYQCELGLAHGPHCACSLNLWVLSLPCPSICKEPVTALEDYLVVLHL